MNVNPIEMQRNLSGVSYPASKDDVVRQAKENGAGKEVMEALKSLPDKEYDSPTAINKEVGGGS
ncbi:DUF2795 domain-containing protein [Streptomyces sudanensis]|uniref:DUF2795 domain-containing protein n=1 Tax=Streptomyces sudanensis TaxID=436397 RepID=UPI0020CBFA95|nr:DUF2795 domain-containing protein [Streptomyces sudanensis]MCP9989045.1 DUF2795 domain-containing protein [Streptomyces sudanensis]